MPWLSTIDLWSFARLAEYVVPDDIEWNKYQSLVEEARYDEFKYLVRSEQYPQ